MELPQKTHDRTFSILKALGIVCIVAGHAALGTPVVTFVYLFHVALFFFVAGYFFRDDRLPGPGSFMRAKVRRLYLPYLGYGLAAVWLHNTLLHLHVIAFDFSARKPLEAYDAAEVLYRSLRVIGCSYWEQIVATAWFPAALFIALTLFYGITYASGLFFDDGRRGFLVRNVVVAAIALSGIACAGLPRLFPGWHILCRTCVVAGLLLIGRLYGRYRDRIPLRVGWATLALGLLVAATAARYRINVGALELGNRFFFLAVTLAGCYFMLTLARTIDRSDGRIARWLDRVGRNTFTIMMLHLAVFKLVNLLLIGIYHLPLRALAYVVVPGLNHRWWPVYVAAGVVVPLLLAGACDRAGAAIRSFLQRRPGSAAMHG